MKALKTFGEAGKLASINGEINGQPTARAFVENVLSKYLKIIKVCNAAEECGFPSQIQPSDPSYRWKSTSNNIKWSSIVGGQSQTHIGADLNNADLGIYVMTADGFSARILYNPICARNSKEITFTVYNNDCSSFKDCWFYPLDAACMNVIYDMNGIKGPNHVGEDIGFVTTFWSGLKTTSAAPGIISYEEAKSVFDEGAKTNAEAQNACNNLGSRKALYTLPNIDELSSLYMNKNLASMPGGNYGFWSGSPVVGRSNYMWGMWHVGPRYHYNANQPGYNIRAWCVRR